MAGALPLTAWKRVLKLASLPHHDRKPRVLMVSHLADRTGAPRVAVDVVRSLLDAGWQCTVAVRRRGSLETDFQRTGARVIHEPLGRDWRPRTWKGADRLRDGFQRLMASLIILRVRPDVVWCNTMESGCYVHPAVRLRRGVVLYSLEPRTHLAHAVARWGLQAAPSSALMVGAAPSTVRHLAELVHGSNRVSALEYAPDPSRITSLASATVPDLPTHGLLIGGCGKASERKGVDLWLEVATAVIPAISDLDPHFLWIGDEAPPDFESRAPGTGSLAGRVTFTGSLENPYPWLAALDLFILTSRADPFPLVVMESMLLGKPVVAFAVDDVPAQVGEAGILIEPLRTDDLSAAVIDVLRDPDRLTHLASAAKARAAAAFSHDRFRADVLDIATEALTRSRRSARRNRA